MINAIKELENYIKKLDLIIEENNETIYNNNVIIEELERENNIYIQKKEEILNAIAQLSLTN
jgi:hypothetical protein